MIFETHAHYDDEAFEKDRDLLLKSMHAEGVGTILNVGASFQGVLDTVKLTEQYPFVYGAVGIHPDEVGVLDEEKMKALRGFCDLEKIVAIGEIGLDYYWDKEGRDVQKKWFVRQMAPCQGNRLACYCTQSGRGKGHPGHYEGRAGRLFKRRDSLLFLLERTGKRIHEHGIFSWHWRRGDFQEWKEAKGSSGVCTP